LGTTILDTSSLIALALAQKDTETPNDARTFWQLHGGIDEAIEAFVLYDNLLFDGPSLRRNTGRLPQLETLSKFGQVVSHSGTELEREVYGLLLERYLPFFGESSAVTSVVGHLHVGDWDLADLDGNRYYPSAGWRQIESEMTTEAREVAHELRKQFGAHVDHSGAATALLLRTLYYDCLQQCTGSDLVLHPLKGQFLTQLRRHMAFKHGKPSSGQPAGGELLNRFDEKVRREFYMRRDAWLGQRNLDYEIPMLTAYVLGKCSSWQDLFKVIEEVRESKQARQFRTSVDWLLHASRQHRNDEVDGVLAEIAAAADEWAKSLKLKGPKKKVTVGFPLLGLGLETELEVADVKLTKTPGDRLLVFIHTLLRES
jgi:hypothetical protein